MEKNRKSPTPVKVAIDSKSDMDVVQNLEEIQKRVAELKQAIEAGAPLSMGKTNMLSGLLKSLRYSMGAW